MYGPFSCGRLAGNMGQFCLWRVRAGEASTRLSISEAKLARELQETDLCRIDIVGQRWGLRPRSWGTARRKRTRVLRQVIDSFDPLRDPIASSVSLLLRAFLQYLTCISCLWLCRSWMIRHVV